MPIVVTPGTPDPGDTETATVPRIVKLVLNGQTVVVDLLALA